MSRKVASATMRRRSQLGVGGGRGMLKMTKYTSLPNLVRLGQWEQVSEYYYYYYYCYYYR